MNHKYLVAIVLSGLALIAGESTGKPLEGPEISTMSNHVARENLHHPESSKASDLGKRLLYFCLRHNMIKSCII